MLRVSVITPSYNQGKYLEETVKSVLGQHYPNFEFIIIDGGSTDDSVNIIRKYEKDISYWISEPDKGQSNAVNKGLQIASGDIIGWINSDDVYYEGTILKAVQVFTEHPEIDVVFGNVNFIDENGKVLHHTNEIKVDYNTYLFTERCYHANAAGFFRRRCFDKFGMLREDLTYTMDYELYLRFAFNRCKFYQLNDVLGSYRLHSQSKTHENADKMAYECKESAAAYKDRMQMSPAFYGPLKWLFVIYRIVRKILSSAYSPKNMLRGFTFRTKYGAQHTDKGHHHSE
jgi:glycosyltransferase involved in cell wall biosynthesis